MKDENGVNMGNQERYKFPSAEVLLDMNEAYFTGYNPSS